MSNTRKSISVFIPHLGCPCRCTFCNQRAIAGTVKMPTREDIEKAVETAVKYTRPENLEIAFFGGSFTMIDRADMLFFLDLAKRLVERYRLYGIRFSTRPDGITEEIMGVLEDYPVTAIEIGAQSMNDGVLFKSQRGHTAADTVKAAELVKKSGKQLVLQMMAGMPESTAEEDVKTAERLCGLKPDAVRIYPLLVLAGTELERQYNRREYTPLTLDGAVCRTCAIMRVFERENIPVIKVGLHAEEGFDSGKTLVAGPYHQAFRELCEGQIYLAKILENYSGGDVVIYCAETELSKVKGHKKANENYLKLHYPGANISFAVSENLKKGEIIVAKG